MNPMMRNSAKKKKTPANKGQVDFEKLDDRVMMSATPWTSDVSSETASVSRSAFVARGDTDETVNRAVGQEEVRATHAFGALGGSVGKPDNEDDSDWGPAGPYVSEFVNAYVSKLIERLDRYERYFQNVGDNVDGLRHALDQVHRNIAQLVDQLADPPPDPWNEADIARPEPQPWQASDFVFEAVTEIGQTIADHFNVRGEHLQIVESRTTSFDDFIKELEEFTKQRHLNVGHDPNPDWNLQVLEFADHIVSEMMNMPEIVSATSDVLGYDVLPNPLDDDDLGPIGPVAMRAVLYESMLELLVEAEPDREPWQVALFDTVAQGISDSASDASGPNAGDAVGSWNHDVVFDNSDFVDDISAGLYGTRRGG